MPHLIMPSSENRMKEIDTLIHEVISNNQPKKQIKKTTKKKKFENWKMPPPPERFIKHKKNDPL